MPRRERHRREIVGDRVGRALLPLLLFALLSGPASAGDTAMSATLAEVDRRIAEIEDLLDSAHFHTALGMSRSALAELDASDRFRVEGMRRARLHLLRATAEIALDQRAEALESMRQALRADPGLVLDRDEVSPKLLALLQEVRQGTSLAGGQP